MKRALKTQPAPQTDPSTSTRAEGRSARALRATDQAASVIASQLSRPFGTMDEQAVAECLELGMAALRRNDLLPFEAMLLNQAQGLQAIFTGLAGRAAEQTQLSQYEAYMRLALRAQSQCRATLETLAAMKNPNSPTFIRQTNIAHGPQQVNYRTAL